MNLYIQHVFLLSQKIVVSKARKRKSIKTKMANSREVLSFVWKVGPGNRLLFVIGCVAGVATVLCIRSSIASRL